MPHSLLSSLALLSSKCCRHRVLFSVHISDFLTDAKVNELVEWIHTLDQSLEISIEGVYDIDSTGLILEASHSLYSKLGNLPRVRLICNNAQGNKVLVFRTCQI